MKFVVKPARRGLLKRNQWRVVLIADNGQNLMTSETYGNKGDAIALTELVRGANEATVDYG